MANDQTVGPVGPEIRKTVETEGYIFLYERKEGVPEVVPVVSPAVLDAVPKRVEGVKKGKDCPEGEIRNPKTGRCVDANGKIGRQLLKEAGKA
jgi:hypothetical protein